MVTVVQLVEHQVVILGVAGSSPVSHPYVISRDILDSIRRDMVDSEHRELRTLFLIHGALVFHRCVFFNMLG